MFTIPYNKKESKEKKISLLLNYPGCFLYRMTDYILLEDVIYLDYVVEAEVYKILDGYTGVRVRVSGFACGLFEDLSADRDSRRQW